MQILSHEHHISTLCRVLMVNHSTYYKILKQRFNPAKPNTSWVCDITYLRAAGRTFAEILILRGLFFTLTAALNLLLRFFAIIWTVWI